MNTPLSTLVPGRRLFGNDLRRTSQAINICSPQCNGEQPEIRGEAYPLMMDPSGALLLHLTESPGPRVRPHPRQSSAPGHASNERHRPIRQSPTSILRRKFQTTWHLLLGQTEARGYAPQRAFPALTAWGWSWPFDLLLATHSLPEARLERPTPLAQPVRAWIES